MKWSEKQFLESSVPYIEMIAEELSRRYREQKKDLEMAKMKARKH